MPKIEIAILTERMNRPIIGGDTTIFGLPDSYQRQLDEHDALDVVDLGRLLSAVAEQQAIDLGDELHHADFVVTTDPLMVMERGAMHDCDVCRAGVNSALRALKEHPEQSLVVGVLYWAGGEGGI